MDAIEASRLGRTYHATTGVFRRRRTHIDALGALDLAVPTGSLYGLLGPNGAGKTTTVRILATLLLPTRGSARVLGFDVVSQAREVRRRIGLVLSGDRGLYDRLSALDNLRYFAELYGLPHRVQRGRIAEILALVGLEGRERERVEGYSRGMRQRLHLARSLLHDPPVLFLDEPSLGIDPRGARELREILRRLVGAGKTILLTTHYMAEADALCDRIGIIARGDIVAEGTPEELKSRVNAGRVLEIETYGASDGVLDGIRRLRGVRSLTVEDRGPAQLLAVRVGQDAELTRLVLDHLGDAGVGRFSIRDPTLEDAYLSLVS